MRLLHYSEKPITFDRGFRYGEAGFFKPPGFWVSVAGDDDWPAWCHATGNWIDSLTCAHLVTLRPTANVLHVATPGEFDAFQSEYLKPIPPFQVFCAIDWNAVAAKYDGLIIAPFQWRRRRAIGGEWYWPWDCASGVFWNLDAIESVTPELP